MSVIFDEAVALYRECFKVYANEPEIIIGHALEHGNIHLYREDGRAVNMICTSRIADEGFCAEYIFAVCTKPEHRKRGIFTKHFSEVIGNKPCVLIPENESLFAFYERLGFSPIYALEAEIVGENRLYKFETNIERLYGIYEKSFHFPKKPKELFMASIKAHIEYGGSVYTDGISAVLVYENNVTDIYSPTVESAYEITKNAIDGKFNAIFPLEAEELLISKKINFEKKKTAMIKNVDMPNIYINTLFN